MGTAAARAATGQTPPPPRACALSGTHTRYGICAVRSDQGGLWNAAQAAGQGNPPSSSHSDRKSVV